jgi:hypothetical protein
LHGVPQVRFVHDVVAVEYRAGLVAADAHGNLCQHPEERL